MYPEKEYINEGKKNFCRPLALLGYRGDPADTRLVMGYKQFLCFLVEQASPTIRHEHFSSRTVDKNTHDPHPGLILEDN